MLHSSLVSVHQYFEWLVHSNQCFLIYTSGCLISNAHHLLGSICSIMAPYIFINHYQGTPFHGCTSALPQVAHHQAMTAPSVAQSLVWCFLPYFYFVALEGC